MATVRTTCEIYRHKFIVLLYSPLQLCNEVRLAAVAVTVTVDVAAAAPPRSCCCCCYFEVVLGMLLLFRWLRALLRSLLRFRFIRFTFSARILCIHVLHIFTFIRRFAFVLIKFCKFDTINCHCHCCSCCYTCCCCCCCNCSFYLQINAIV